MIYNNTWVVHGISPHKSKTHWLQEAWKYMFPAGELSAPQNNLLFLLLKWLSRVLLPVQPQMCQKTPSLYKTIISNLLKTAFQLPYPLSNATGEPLFRQLPKTSRIYYMHVIAHKQDILPVCKSRWLHFPCWCPGRERKSLSVLKTRNKISPFKWQPLPKATFKRQTL